MIADGFGQLQSFRSARDDRALQAYFRALEDARAQAAQEEAAYQNDANRALQSQALARDSQKDNYFNALREREFQTGRTDVANNLKLAYDDMDSREGLYREKQDAIEKQTKEREAQSLFGQLVGAIDNGQIKDLRELDAYKSLLPDDMYGRVVQHFGGVLADQKYNAAERTSQFNATYPKRPAIEPKLAARIADDYFRAVGEHHDDTTPAGMADAVDTLRSMRKQPWYNVTGKIDGVPVRAASDIDLKNAQSQYDLGLANRQRNFKTFTTEKADRALLKGVVPNEDTMSFIPAISTRAEYLNAVKGATNAPPTAVAPARAPVAAPPDVGTQAAQIRAQFKAGRITKDEALRQLRAIGFE